MPLQTLYWSWICLLHHTLNSSVNECDEQQCNENECGMDSNLIEMYTFYIKEIID